MEGLIKGILDVALGGNKRDEDEVDQQSRSTSWANVVSGEKDDEENYNGRNSNRRNEEGNYERNEEWRSGGSQFSRRPQKAVNEGYEDNRQGDYNRRDPGEQNVEESNDGWETVGKKHPKKQVRKDNWDNFKRPAAEQDYSDEVEHNSQMEPT